MDAESFRRLYERYAPALRSYLRFACRDASLADDLLQESFLRLLGRNLSGLVEAEQKSYLYKAAHSALVDHARNANRHRRLNDRLALEEMPVTEELSLPPDISGALRQLQERDQRILWLAYVEGFSHREIAGVIDVAEKSVRVILLRARERLAKVLADQGIGREEVL